MQVILAVLAVWFLLRPKTAEPSASSAVGVVPVEGITNKDAQAVAEALNGFPPSTPVVYVDGDVTRETTTGKLAEDYLAAQLMGDATFLPTNPRESYHVPNTNLPFAV